MSLACLYQELEAVLVSGQVIQLVRKYSELASDYEGRSLQTELGLFLNLPVVKNCSGKGEAHEASEAQSRHPYSWTEPKQPSEWARSGSI